MEGVEPSSSLLMEMRAPFYMSCDSFSGLPAGWIMPGVGGHSLADARSAVSESHKPRPSKLKKTIDEPDSSSHKLCSPHLVPPHTRWIVCPGRACLLQCAWPSHTPAARVGAHQFGFQPKWSPPPCRSCGYKKGSLTIFQTMLLCEAWSGLDTIYGVKSRAALSIKRLL